MFFFLQLSSLQIVSRCPFTKSLSCLILTKMAISRVTVFPLLLNRILQWCSAVIVMGLTSYFVTRGLRGEHSKYTEVIVCHSKDWL